MAGRHRDDLEARVARLERLLNRVLELLQERQGERVAPIREAESADTRAGPPVMTTEIVAPGAEAAAAEGEAAVTEPGPTPVEATQAHAESPLASFGTLLKDVPGAPDRYRPEEAADDPGRPAAPPPTGKTPPVTEAKPPAGKPGPRSDPGVMDGLATLASGGTLLGRLGIVLLLLSVAFFFKYSIDQGWLVEWVRLAIGVAAGVILLALGFRGAGKGEPLGTVLAGGGIATFFITGFVGHQWYELVSYPVAFGFLVVASGLGILLSLRSGLQALAMVGLIGALATPLLLTAPAPEVAGLALYVSLIIASICAIYLARGWRALLLMGVVTSWLVLSVAVAGATDPPGPSWWVVQASIGFCTLAFWLVPLLRARLRAGDPGRWLRPESAYAAQGEDGQQDVAGPGPHSWVGLDGRSAAGGVYVPWNVHLDILSLMMPLVGIGFSAWLWELSRLELGWLFLGTALLAQGVGTWIARSSDPEDSAATQRYVAILLSTVGLGLVLTGDVLYLAFIAEAAALIAVGSRKGSKVLMGLGGAVELLVVALFLVRLATGGTLLEGDLSSVFDLVAVGGAAFIGSRLQDRELRRACFVGAYLALLGFTARELMAYPSLLYLAFLVESVATHVVASRKSSQLLESLGFVSLAVAGVLFLAGMASGRTVSEGDFTLLVDVAALAAAVYVGTLASTSQVRVGLFAGAYLGLLALFGRELGDFAVLLYAVYILTAVLTQIASHRRGSPLFSGLGHLPAVLILVQFVESLGSGTSLSAGELVSLVDLAAVGAAAYVGTLLGSKELRLVYLYAAYLGLLAWTGRELYPLEQGQALMSLAFGLEGTVLLVWGLLSDRPLMQKTGMATLLLVVGKILLIDLAAVEPIWRVLLLFLFAVLFLVLSKVVQGRRGAAGGSG